MSGQMALSGDTAWNATTGTFDHSETSPKAARMDAKQFAGLIAERFDTSALSPDQKAKALTMLDDAAVYLHQADPTNRHDRSPTIDAVAEEWANIGISVAQATHMIDTSLAYNDREEDQQQGMAFVSDRSDQAAEMER